MNLLFVCLTTLLCPLSNAAEPDTIILKAGSNSKVIFYGKTGEDLKNLEQLDLNRIIRDLNFRQANQDTAQVLNVKLENAAFVNSEMPNPTGWREKFLQNTFLNLHLGTGSHVNRYVFFNPPPSALNHPTATLQSQILLRNKLSLSASVLHDMKLVTMPKANLSLRYGIGAGVTIQQYVHWNILENVPNEDVSEVSGRAFSLLGREGIAASQSDFNAFQTFAQVAPRFSLKNAKGQSTWYFSIGARLNYNKIFENMDPAAQSAVLNVNTPDGGKTTTISPIISGKGYELRGKNSNFGVSYLAEIGYKAVGLFVNYYPNYLPVHTKVQPGVTGSGAGYNQRNGKLGYISFGVKLGR
ncbi:hypothetical protein [Dyadobacter fanqingshengii]|uniref:Outer membrane protein beta-barrel domain-containing protein n=1 Tax=Dyadobacter fanqingshengii TaxID=2906443 RepID=A0A9X1PA19_9BACT|nr:hypothetical protein [Dyadobacter fanqingshengii]MCF0041126.1 hypothetical protein [Dyadobacter fanqingshengii]USJ37147.1 hypothetical protein NFI81_05070 [Dyadobacter fanqingshengii]